MLMQLHAGGATLQLLHCHGHAPCPRFSAALPPSQLESPPSRSFVQVSRPTRFHMGSTTRGGAVITAAATGAHPSGCPKRARAPPPPPPPPPGEGRGILMTCTSLRAS